MSKDQKLARIISIFKSRNLALIDENNELRRSNEELRQRLTMYEHGASFRYSGSSGIKEQKEEEIKVEVLEPDLSTVNVKTGMSQAALDFIKGLESMPVLPGPVEKSDTVKKPPEPESKEDAPKACVFTQ